MMSISKWRQFSVVAACQFCAFSIGGSITYPTLLLEQFEANDTLDLNTRSWMGSIHGLAGTSAILMPIFSQRFGRKIGFMLSSLILLIGWILAYTATSAAQILISESFQGLGTNSIVVISNMCMSEMLSPKYRHISMQTFSVVLHLGITCCGILGRYCNYKTVTLVMLSSTCACAVIVVFWAESPYWLACRGQFKKCKRNFIKLRGNDKDSIKELNELITAQTENLSNVNKIETFTLQGFWKQLSSRDFYVSTFHAFMMFNLMYLSGSGVIFLYYIDIVTKTINDPSFTHYSGIAIYTISFVGSIAMIFFTTYFKNKTIILFSAYAVIICLLSTFIVTSLQVYGILAKDSHLPAYCMIVFSAFKGFSAIYYVAAEIIPVRHRNIGGALYVIYNCFLSTGVLKLSPYMFLFLGYSGTFLIFTINTCICTLFIWRCVPETKGRTLQELEDFYMHGKFVKRNSDDVEKTDCEESIPLEPKFK